jgi:redox-sensitive bicupin YhaK (pirin superfamily)
MSTEFNSRKTSTVVTNRLTPEGVGVTVLRSIGQNPRYFSPFALLDNFNLEANSLSRRIGFHPHPHRGMSTLTYILPEHPDPNVKENGSVKHMDHKGNQGIIGPGDIQFMSAGKGIVHSEMPADEKAISGLQLWINLRKEDKMMEPEYQEYTSEQLPVIEQDGIWAKIIMGSALGNEAKVKTRTPVHYIHYKLKPNTTLNHPLPPHWNTFLYSFNGSALVGNDRSLAKAKQTVFFEKGLGAAEAEANSNNDPNPVIDQGYGVTITSNSDGFDFVLISGEPLTDGAKVIQHGPMIVDSQEALEQAFDDFYNGANGFEGAQEFSRKWKP